MTDERLADIRLKVAVVRRALDECRRRLAALHQRLQGGSGESASPPVADGGTDRLFQASAPLDDRELHFEALDTEDPRRDER